MGTYVFTTPDGWILVEAESALQAFNIGLTDALRDEMMVEHFGGEAETELFLRENWSDCSLREADESDLELNTATIRSLDHPNIHGDVVEFVTSEEDIPAYDEEEDFLHMLASIGLPV